MSTKNLCGKARKIDAPYAVYKGFGPLGETEVRVLKVYQSREKEKANPYARWFVAVKSDYTYGSFDMGDAYINETVKGLYLREASPEFKEQYNVRTF
jgi:hypothetical protein